MTNDKLEVLTVGGGCFWCIEAVFQRVIGVTSVTSGYSGGAEDSPTYHRHGSHAEVIEVQYDSQILKLPDLLDVFFAIHDPTTLNRQGVDVGESYRSIILYSEEAQVAEIKAAIIRAQELWGKEVVTEVKQLDKFYKAEQYHQDYYNQNQDNNYCQVMIDPKLAKARQKFAHLMKPL